MILVALVPLLELHVRDLDEPRAAMRELDQQIRCHPPEPLRMVDLDEPAEPLPGRERRLILVDALVALAIRPLDLARGSRGRAKHVDVDAALAALVAERQALARVVRELAAGDDDQALLR